MTTEFWIGTLVSIPLGIGTSLATPPIQRWIDSRSEAAALNSQRRMREVYQEAFFYTHHHDAFTQLLILAAIRMVVPALGTVIATTLFSAVIFVQRSFLSRREGSFLLTLCLLMLISSSMSFFLRYAGVLTQFWRVNNFKKYASKVPLEIRREAEARLSKLADDSSHQ